VSIQKAEDVLGFHPVQTIGHVQDLYDNLRKFKDFDNPNYYNIQTLRH
jgi:hypothetical protein